MIKCLYYLDGNTHLSDLPVLASFFQQPDITVAEEYNVFINAIQGLYDLLSTLLTRQDKSCCSLYQLYGALDEGPLFKNLKT